MAQLTSRKLSEFFEDFLKTFKDRSKGYRYRERVSQVIAAGGTSLVVDYDDLIHFNEELCNQLTQDPDKALQEFRTAAYETMSSENAPYADRVRRQIQVRIKGITDMVPLRKIDTSHLDKLIAFTGMVVRTSELRPLLEDAAYVCANEHVTMVAQEGPEIKRPLRCSDESCAAPKNLELDQKRSKFVDSQNMRVQELPEELPPGQLPRFFDVDIEGDIVNTARPGDRIILSGVVRAEPDLTPGLGRSRLFRSKIESNYIEILGKDPGQLQITKEDELLIRNTATSQGAYQKLISSIAPAILGHDAVKEALLLLLCGSPQTTLPDGTKLRGDINILLVGDPGVAKSEMLKFAAQVAPRGIFASGRGSTAAGLSAAVIREKNVLMLEAGVVVLADQGVACLTEDSEVYTGDRLVSFKELWESNPGKVWLTKTGREAKSVVLPVSIYEKKARADIPGMAFAVMRRRHSGEIMHLKLASGLSLRVTKEHLLKRTTNVKNLWVRADQVRPGDELRAPVRVFKPAATIDYSPEESYVIGCTYGDGWLGAHGITISQSKSNSDVIRIIQERMPSVFATYDKGDRVRQLGKYMLVSRMYQLFTTDRRTVTRTHFLLRNPSIDNVLMLTDRSLWAFLAGVFDTDGDLNHVAGQVVAVRMYPTKSEHELGILLYALRRLGVYARVHGKTKSIPLIQISGADITRFLTGVQDFSVKLRREFQEIHIRHQGRRSLKRGCEKVASVGKEVYDGYVYDLSVSRFHNFETSLVYVHNCIDEFDKMRPEDRSALHEQMEQNTVTIAKGGIYATLNARTSILAAINPVLGKYDAYQNLTDNINLPIPLLSRFDLIFVIRDTPTPAQDEALASHILEVHRKRSFARTPAIQFDLLKKYLSYTKNVNPTLTADAEERLKEYYLSLRRSSTEGQIGATPRTLESLIRIATARARLLLREQVTEEDALAAISLMRRMVEEVLTDATTQTRADFGVIFGKPVGEKNRLSAAMQLFRQMEGEGSQRKPVESRLFREELIKVVKLTDEDADKLIGSMLREGIIYESKTGFFRRVGS